jgi:hypothetical protein
MPFAGILSALGITLTRTANLWAGRSLFILFAASIAPLTAYMAGTFIQQRWAALLAGSLAVFSGFYLVYLPTTETFAISMVLGAVIFLLILKLQRDVNPEPAEGAYNRGRAIGRPTASPLWVYFAGGAASGLMFMTRADGILWLIMMVSAILFQFLFPIQVAPGKNSLDSSLRPWIAFLVCVGAFLIVAFPWFFRNWQVFGTVFAPGSSRTLWLTRYDELFSYPADQLTLTRWIDSGLGKIFQVRAWALGLNAVTAFAVQGVIFLLPLVLAGMKVRLKDWRVMIGGAGWLLMFLVMTLIFPLQGARGGFFHAGAGFQTLIWALVPVGLSEFVSWGKRNRNWNPGAALPRFGISVVVMTLLLTGVVSWQRLGGAPGALAAWGAKERRYVQVEAYLDEFNRGVDSAIMVNNPPGYYAVNGRQAIVIPDGGLVEVLAAGKKFGADYLVLDKDYPQGLNDIFMQAGDQPGLKYLETIADMQIYRLER